MTRLMAFATSTSVPIQSRWQRRVCSNRHLRSLPQRTQPQHCTNHVVKCALEPLVLSEDTVQLALTEVEDKLGSVFGNSVENRNVGITGRVELASLDGPIVVLRLRGRFWHKRTDVFARVSAYLQERIPEICDLEIEDPEQLNDADPPPQ